MAIVKTALIKVAQGGYTGQRDEWEEYSRPYVVTVDGDMIVLTEARYVDSLLANSKSVVKKPGLRFSKTELLEAIGFLQALDKDA